MIKNKAFTLIEVLLCVVLIMLLTSTVVFNFYTLNNRSRIVESTYQVEGLIKFAKAQAANTGRNVQLDLNEGATNIITWEPNPLEKPGEYVEFNEFSWENTDFTNYVEIKNIYSIDIDENNIVGNESTNTDLIKPIKFYPDGTCDSTKLVIISKETTNYRSIINILGYIGEVSHKVISEEDSEEKNEILLDK